MVLKINFDKEFERKFRELAMKKHGFYKGSIKKAGEEALREWIKTEDRSLPSVKDPIKLIEGILISERGKKSSVELQHEAKKLWLK